MSDEISNRVGDYEILNEIGAGGMGRVYRVRNVISDRIEAMKILLPDLAGRQELAARFLREIKLLASLNHPNIAQLRTAFTHENQLVMIMEYVEGTSMAVRLAAGPISISEALDYIDQVLNALSYAHQHNVVHRDIKPGNMMLTPQGVVKVMDFGIARSDSDSTLTMSGTSLGTVNYMSPEQVKGERTDPRSDLYSVGICLYEMVTGKKPFQEGSDFSIMSAHVKEAPRPPAELQPDLPPALNEIILLAIAKEPGERFQTATAFRNALNNVRGSSSTAQIASFAAGRSATSVPAAYVPPAPTGTQVATFAAAAPGTQQAPISSVPMPPPQPAGGHRGLYMTLGALIVLAGLVAAGIYLPKKGKADERVQTPAPAAPAPAAPAPETTTTDNPAPPQPPVVLAGEGAKVHSHQAAAEPPGPNIHELEDEIDQLSARAGAVNSSLDRLRQQQASAGYGLRGDISERQELMKVNLSRAQDAAEHHDAVKAKKYVDKTQADMDVLEKFLGR